MVNEMHRCTINLCDIELPYIFQNSPPSSKKVEERKRYFKRMGEFPKLIVRSDDHRLLDGYASYVAAKEMGKTKVEVTMLSPKESINYTTNVNQKHPKSSDSRKKKRIQNNKGTRCYICGRKLYNKTDKEYDGTNEFTIDHKIPLFKGGTNTMDNMFPCCNVCNGLKGDFNYSRSLRNLIIAELRTRNIEPEPEKRGRD